jgi:hypothetical protein
MVASTGTIGPALSWRVCIYCLEKKPASAFMRAAGCASA